MMMMGDGEQFALHNPNGDENNDGFDEDRFKQTLGLLKNNKQVVLRRRAAEELRIVLAARPLDVPYQNEVVDVFCKTLKNAKEDVVVMEQILWTLTNLSHASSPIIHAMLCSSKGIVKFIAHPAKYSSSKSVRNQAIMCLGNFAADCPQCRFCVAVTEVHETIIDYLANSATLTKKEQNMFAWTLRNIFRPVSSRHDYAIRVKDKEKLIKVINKLISINPPDNTVKQGVAILQEWIAMDDRKQTPALIAKDETMMNHLLELFEADNDEVSSIIVRIIGNIAFTDDDLIQRILNFGFVEAMEARILSNSTNVDVISALGTNLQADIFWCLSNIIGSHRPEFVRAIYSKTDLCMNIIANCFSYDTILRREALFCTINLASFFTGEEKHEMYLYYFGRIMIDTLIGFTTESNLDMINAIAALVIHIVEDLKKRCAFYKNLIRDYDLQHALQQRLNWTRDALQTMNLTPVEKKDLEKLLTLCNDALKLIAEFKCLPASLATPEIAPRVPARHLLPSHSTHSPFNGFSFFFRKPLNNTTTTKKTASSFPIDAMDLD